jgi:hypothetical protein
MRKALAIFLSLMLLVSLPGVLAETAAAPVEPGTAYIMFGDKGWVNQYFLDGKEYAAVAENVLVTQPGDYKVSLSFPADAPAKGIEFAALGIKEGESLFPGMAFTVKDVKINGVSVPLGQPYTSSDDKIETRSNLYNVWVGDLPDDARIAAGDINSSSAVVIAEDAFASVTTIEVFFTLEEATVFKTPSLKPVPEEATAYIMYADEAWAAQYWLDGNEYPVTAANVPVSGEGQYEVSLAFPEDAPAKGLAFMALGLKDGELVLPGYVYRLDSLKVNGEEIPFTKGYTSSDDKIETRVNIFNAWVGELPDDARTPDGSLEGAAPIVVDPALFASVSAVSVTFTAISPAAEAYIMYADAGWTEDHQYWLDGKDWATKATNATVKGEGDYEVSLLFPEGSPALGVAFAALAIKDGEKIFPNYIYTIREILVNGESIALTPGYTSSDDMIETRSNIFNEWVSELPADARVAEGDVSASSPKMVDPAAFASVQTLTVRFSVKKGEPKAPVVESKINPDGYPAFLMFGDEDWTWENLKPGTAGDTVVLGDGVYEVFISKETLPEDKTAEDPTGASVFNIDITDLGAAMSEIGTVYSSKEAGNQLEVAIAVFVDNERVEVRNDRLIYGDIENNKKLRIEIYNVYGTGTMDLSPIAPEKITPKQELRVVFSLKGTGFNTDSATDLEAYLATK